MSTSVFLEAWGKPLLILHALLAILLLGSMTHHVLLTVPYLWGKFRKLRLEKIYVHVVAVSYSLTFAVGALIYPNYRYHVRDQYFDAHHPWASNLFDIKEHWAGIGLGLMIAFWLLSRQVQPQSDRRLLLVYVFLSVSLTVIVWFNLISGLWLTAIKGV